MCPPSSLTPLLNPLLSSPPPNPPSPIPDYIPTSPLCAAAYALAATHLPTAILNHSLRVYLYASALATNGTTTTNNQNFPSPSAAVYAPGDSTSGEKHDLLFTACILHDIGCTSPFDTSPLRFEVEGADAAKTLLLSHSAGRASPADVDDVWVAIACHTSAHIAERISALACLVRVGVLFDFGVVGRLGVGVAGGGRGEEVEGILTEELTREVEGRFPRLQAEKVLGDAVVKQAREKREKAPAASWAGVMLRAAEEEGPGWEGVNRAF